MKIVNPLYDKAFKYLMDNEPLTRKILSVIIDEDIISLESKPQETVVYIKGTQIPVSRFDFKAIIRTQTGERFNVLIEVQKSRSPSPEPRFRRYLGQNYIKEQTFINAEGNEETAHLPIISIYFLGYNIGHGEYDTPGIIVNNDVTDAITKECISTKHKFIQLLTHPCYILQVNRLKPERKSRLEKMLTLFDQSYCTSDDYILDLNEIDDEFNEIVSYLSLPTQDEAFVRSLAYEADYDKDIANKEEEIKELKQKEAEARQKEAEARQREKKTQMRMAKKMLKYGEPIEEIIKETGLSKDEINNL